MADKHFASYTEKFTTPIGDWMKEPGGTWEGLGRSLLGAAPLGAAAIGGHFADVINYPLEVVGGQGYGFLDAIGNHTGLWEPSHDPNHTADHGPTGHNVTSVPDFTPAPPPEENFCADQNSTGAPDTTGQDIDYNGEGI
ncbi:hypothetical protein EB75_10645 [Mycobacterium sp. ST-F2]|uniref:hypothetical protein n=1 Tax=Mycobacterium sp. ST-F2 TaxID=1490484 RepID=UPI00093F4D46|nr:hypothetical protein [Mycobacterium sp. ST-F2]OKH83188.1 hypothetical protein EB75_10645 [Mycobacterium sp. ST-F2]